MMFTVPRRTLAQAAIFDGTGLQSGERCQVRIEPGNDGIVFVHEGDRVAARVQNVTGTERCTSLGPVRTIEHLMSALAGAEITDADIVVDGEELPGLDGSAEPWLIGIEHAGIDRLAGELTGSISDHVMISDADASIEIRPGTGNLRYVFDREGWWHGCQQVDHAFSQEAYRSEIAPARTFVHDDQIEAALEMGFGRGATEKNTLIIGKQGYLCEARFDDEPARHKLLDCIGDLYLTGVPLCALDIVAIRSGHRMNVAAAEELAGSTVVR